MKYAMLSLVFVLLLGLVGCGDQDKQERSPSSSRSKKEKDLIVVESDEGTIRMRNPEDFANAVEKRLEDLGKGGNAELTDFRKLKEFLPSRLGWYVRTEHKGSKAGVAGFGASTAEATYSSAGTTFTVRIADVGPMGGLMNLFSEIGELEMENTTQDGYERTTTIEGFKAIEKYQKADGRGDLTIMVGNRIVVSLEGNNLKANTLRNAAEKLNLAKLAKL